MIILVKDSRYMKTLFLLMFPFLGIAITITTVVGYYNEDDLDHNSQNGFYPYEEETNDTIDELIMESIQGLEGVTRDDSDVLTELDMYLTQEQFYELYQASQSHNDRRRRKAIRSVARRWPEGIVPYKMAERHFSKRDEYMIQRAMTEIERYTCVTFRPATSTDSNFIQFQDGESCSSHLGMVHNGMQVVNLSRHYCRYKGLYLHEIGHALGLVHEHQLPNRDQYIDIIRDNVKPEYLHNFSKYNPKLVDLLGLPYDVTSVMHYGVRSFSKNGKKTIRVRNKTKDDIVGRVYRKELAYTDVYAINRMYNCSEVCVCQCQRKNAFKTEHDNATNCPSKRHCPNQSKCGQDGHVDKNCNCICRDGSRDCDTTKKIPKREECRNRNRNSWKCYMWANQGKCGLNGIILRRRCAKACGICGTKNNSDLCNDVERRCSVWKERGDCVTNSDWMKRNCRVTCGFCCRNNESQFPNHPTKCNNSLYDDDICDRLALMGQCVINAEWMSANCARSCRMCAAFDPFGKDEPKNSTFVSVGSDEFGKRSSVFVSSVDFENSTTVSVGSDDFENGTSVPARIVDLENITSAPVGSDDFGKNTSVNVGSEDLGKSISVPFSYELENSTFVTIDSKDLRNSTSAPVGSADLENSTPVPFGSDDFENSTTLQ